MAAYALATVWACDSLKGVDQQQGPLASGQAARDLVVKIDVPRRVDQVELVFLSVERVMDGDGPRLDGDPAVPLDFEIVEHLLSEFARARWPRF